VIDSAVMNAIAPGKIWLAAVLCVATACSADTRQTTSATAATESPAAAEAPAPAAPTPVTPVGPVTREQVESAVPDWVQAQAESQIDAAAAQGLAAVEPGAEVTIFLGTWCGDSRRELARLWRALDETGGTVPFDIRYIAVDEAKAQPADRIAESAIRFVPTLIVSRGGREVGRIVEHSPNGVEVDLLALLTGKAQGVVTASPNAAENPAEGAASPSH